MYHITYSVPVLPHIAQNTVVCNAAAFVVAVAAAAAVAVAAAFSSRSPACTVPGSCQCLVSAFPAASQAVAAVRMAADIEGNYCCVGKGVVDVGGDSFGLEDIGFALEETHTLLQKELTEDFNLCTVRKKNLRVQSKHI